jgi:RNA polymerase sigma-54 factor
VRVFDEVAMAVGIMLRNDRAQNMNISAQDIGNVLKLIQEFEPKGIAARSLKESFTIQLRDRKFNTQEGRTARQIVREYWSEFSSGEDFIGRLTMENSELLKYVPDAIKVIQTLNPRPGNAEESYLANHQSIVPDFSLLKGADNQYKVKAINPFANRLRVSESYAMINAQYRGKHLDAMHPKLSQELAFCRDKTKEAVEVIKAVEARGPAMEIVANILVGRQKDFLRSGDSKDLVSVKSEIVAQEAGISDSSLNRILNSKYIATENGTFRLKNLMPSPARLKWLQAEEYVLSLFKAEAKNNPITDDQLAKQLASSGFVTSKALVKSMRESLDIPTPLFRKLLYLSQSEFGTAKQGSTLAETTISKHISTEYSELKKGIIRQPYSDQSLAKKLAAVDIHLSVSQIKEIRSDLDIPGDKLRSLFYSQQEKPLYQPEQSSLFTMATHPTSSSISTQEEEAPEEKRISRGV